MEEKIKLSGTYNPTMMATVAMKRSTKWEISTDSRWKHKVKETGFPLQIWISRL